MNESGRNAGAPGGDGAERRAVTVESGGARMAFDGGPELVACPLESIPSIGPFRAARLAKAGIRDTGDLLRACGGGSGRAVVADLTGVAADRLRGLAGLADLLQIPGVTPAFAELLAACGVDNVATLRDCEPGPLADAMMAANEGDRFAEAAPSIAVIEGWLRRAGEMTSRVSA